MTWRPAKNQTSLERLWKDGKLNPFKRNIFKVVRSFLWRLPNSTYPAGEDEYWRSIDVYGQETWNAPHNVWRQMWHFIAGAALGIVLPYLVVASLIAAKESYEAFTNKKLYFKNILDLAVWTTGALASNFIVNYYF